MTRVLRLDITGVPRAWVTREDAARLYALAAVVWTIGAPFCRLHGGVSARTGEQSFCDIHPLIATEGVASEMYDRFVPRLTLCSIYARDHGLCMYCGEHVAFINATRDHVIPLSRGGENSYANVVLAHRGCNARKGCRTPEEAGTPLIAVPFVPTRVEALILGATHHVLEDQMAYLLKKAGRRMTLAA